MSKFLLIFLTIVFSLAIVIIFIGEFVGRKEDKDMDSQYRDENGDHIYYERSLIEKKAFRRMHPQITHIRSFSHLIKSWFST